MNTGRGPAVALEVIVTAEIPTPHGYVFRAPGRRLHQLRVGLGIGRHESILSPCLAYIARHPVAGVIVIDTGLHPDALTDLRRDFGLPMSQLFRGLRPAAQAFDEQLIQRGVRPDEVESVVMTHLHVDHTSGMRLFPNARFTCSSREWHATRGRGASGRGYVRQHLPAPERMNLVDFSAGERFGPFRRTLDLLGDGSMRLIDTRGHTAGHLSILVRSDGKPDILVLGDAAYTLRSIREGILPLLTWNDQASSQTLRELKEFADQNPEAIVIPSHDPEAWRALAGPVGAGASGLNADP